MTNCSAKGCSNNSKKGVKMNYFPKDCKRREQWQLICATLGGMQGWSPCNSSALCEYHFSEDNWEKLRVDGTKKLKITAIPTIFGELVYQVKTKIHTEPRKDVTNSEVLMVHTDPVTKEVNILTPLTRESESVSHSIDMMTTSKSSEIRTEMSEVSSQKMDAYTQLEEKHKKLEEKHKKLEEKHKKLKEKHKKLERLYEKSEKIRICMKKRHKQAYDNYKYTVQKLKKNMSVLEEKGNGKRKIFNTDQVLHLNQEYKRMPKWCDSILVKAYQLKFSSSCEEILEFLKIKVSQLKKE